LLIVLAFRHFLGRRGLGEVGWPFADVLQENRGNLTREIREIFKRKRTKAAKESNLTPN
jgi:hypothetical protein